ncbi:hypothetical protein H6F74_01510 [Trichocoleus sp. FACHB-90]|jgi:hypothetical protein|uniref:DUF7682 family zinc-binding protein n=1 Tax=Cyanophyceae TaxID=3028117 RepID=UPI0016847767|nr:hypothetical protein [Trichocoleus sp. FACHB-90]MBD1833954.1 hypothetical protein [Cyanobacteria bacterium FACHB-472]MBD1924965.1 hypothetical protein [Trichocoleus sp. FACHB-90]
MPTRKKTFPCGHKGYGQICHRCASERATWVQKKQEKQQWEETFADDPIDLRHLPAHLVVKARTIIARLENTRNYTEFKGKRLRHNRTIISIPLSRDYRMICRDCGSRLVPEEVMSHEEYNVCKPGG